ncbi:MAG: crossover junction endodeoxyribonuclease RuvC [Spirochaetes bacterium]|nr:crossover junction endodeoxyribonuclease RuvC [Spirochaetota bacterium]
MTVLGIDPGIAIVGYALLKVNKDQILTLRYGVIKTQKEELPGRIKKINSALQDIIHEFKPSQASIEKIYFNKNTKTAIDVAEVRGSIILTAMNHNISVFDYTPLQVKQAIAGYGKASKHQIQEMVKIILRLKETPCPDDAADALACALCHIHSKKFHDLVRNQA